MSSHLRTLGFSVRMAKNNILDSFSTNRLSHKMMKIWVTQNSLDKFGQFKILQGTNLWGQLSAVNEQFVLFIFLNVSNPCNKIIFQEM